MPKGAASQALDRPCRIDLTAYAHVIWDFNGTLLDDVALCVDVVNGMLRERDRYTISVAQYHELFDFPVEGYYAKLGLTTEPFPDLAHEFCESYDRRIAECGLFAEVPAILGALVDTGIGQSVLSSMEQDMLARLLTRFHLQGFFTAVVGQADRHASGKIASGRLLLDQIGLPRSRILLIGDTLHDDEVATALGIDCVLVAHGHHSRARLAVTGRPLLDSLRELQPRF